MSLLSTWIDKKIDQVLRVNQSQSQDCIGFDIDFDSIKLVQLDQKNPSIVTRLIKKTLPFHIKNQDIKSNLDQLVKYVGDFLEKEGIKSCLAVIAVPKNMTVVKNFFVDPRLTEKEVESRARLEAERQFPDMIDDIYMDFVVLGETNEEPIKKEVMLIACRKDKIAPYQVLFDRLEMRLKVVDVEAYALERALLRVVLQYPQYHHIQLLNVDVEMISSLFFSRGKVLQGVETNINGDQIRKKLASLKQDKLDDEVYKMKCFDIYTEDLMSYFKHTIKFNYVGANIIKPEMILLSGSLARMDYFNVFIETISTCHVDVVNPFKDMSIQNSSEVSSTSYGYEDMMLALGLALTDIK